jgi:hypothetical protein
MNNQQNLFVRFREVPCEMLIGTTEKLLMQLRLRARVREALF